MWGAKIIKALASTPPEQRDLSLSRWSGAELAVHGRPRPPAGWPAMRSNPRSIAPGSFPRDPGFEAKASLALDLYAWQFDGETMDRTSTQSAPMRNPSPRPCAATTRSGPGARANPAVRVRIPSNNGARPVERMDAVWPNAVLVHVPVHASWLNQVEIYFSLPQRKGITGGDFRDLDQLAGRVLAFQDRYNTSAEPSDWTYTRTDLNNYLHRLNKHEPSLAA